MGFCPFQVSSNIEPKLSLVGPEIVPLPIMSPALTGHPLTVWWVNCCAMVQYIYLKLEFVTIVSFCPSGWIAACKWMSKLPFLLFWR